MSLLSASLRSAFAGPAALLALASSSMAAKMVNAISPVEKLRMTSLMGLFQASPPPVEAAASSMGEGAVLTETGPKVLKERPLKTLRYPCPTLRPLRPAGHPHLHRALSATCSSQK